MAHYAKVVDGIVETVIVAEADHIATLEGTWVKTSYNMYGGVYYDNETNVPAEDQSVISGDEARERKNFAAMEYIYDGTGFHAPQHYDSWTLNRTSYQWEPPTPRPDDGKGYYWDEDSESWIKFIEPLTPTKPMPNEGVSPDGNPYRWDVDSESWIEIEM